MGNYFLIILFKFRKNKWTITRSSSNIKSCFNNRRICCKPRNVTFFNLTTAVSLKTHCELRAFRTDKSFSTQLCVIYRYSSWILQPSTVAFDVEVSNCLFVMEPSWMENSFFNTPEGFKFTSTRCRFYHRYYMPRNNPSRMCMLFRSKWN